MVATKKKPQGRPVIGTEDPFRMYGGKPMPGYGEQHYFAEKFLLFPISADHIANGVPGSAPECIVAKAVSSFYNDKFDVEVGRTQVRIIDTKKKRTLRFRLPAALAKRTGLFDTMEFWDLLPGLYKLYPLPKPAKAKRSKVKSKVKGKGRKVAAKVRDVHNNQHVKYVKGRVKSKARKPATRYISRGRVVKWSAMKKKVA